MTILASLLGSAVGFKKPESEEKTQSAQRPAQSQRLPLSTDSSEAAEAIEPYSPLLSAKSGRQFGLFAAGAGFVLLSSTITRRSLVRKYNQLLPKYYQPNIPVNEVYGPLEAVEALSLATVNVFSVATMLVGGALWSADVSTLADMQRKTRRNLGRPGGETDPEAEKEVEEWVASVLAKMKFEDKISRDAQIDGQKAEDRRGPA